MKGNYLNRANSLLEKMEEKQIPNYEVKDINSILILSVKTQVNTWLDLGWMIILLKESAI